jgi:predicted nuclease of predicted toxin-antitoxin system
LRLLIDENVPVKLAEKIAELYPQSIYVLRSEQRSKPDEEVLKFSIAESITLITFDRDFLDILHYPLEMTPGRIVLRFKGLTIENTIARTVAYLYRLEQRGIEITGKLIVFTNKKIRIRTKP